MTPALNIDGRDVPTPIWTGTVRLYWRPDEFENPVQRLYIGGLFIGLVEEWPDPDHPETPWSAWLMTSEDGEGIGFFETMEKAMAALVDAAVKELGK